MSSSTPIICRLSASRIYTLAFIAGVAATPAQTQETTSRAKADVNECPESLEPPRLAGFNEVVDSGKVATALSTLYGRTQAASLTFTVIADSAISVRTIEFTGDPTSADRLRASLEAAIRESARAQRRFRVVVHTGSSASLAIERAHYCPPMPNGRRGSATTQRALTGADLAELQRAGPFKVQLSIDSTGRVTNAVLVQSSGSRVQDEFALNAARSRQFLPARQDGFAVASTFEVVSSRKP